MTPPPGSHEAVALGPDEYLTGAGQLLVHVHMETPDCAAHGCAVHAPSSHHMREWPTAWRADRALMERTCPHGVGHPDPDHIGYLRRHRGTVAADEAAVHGCDGCCRPVHTDEGGEE